MATGDLTTLETVRGYLPSVADSDVQFDALISRLITAVSTKFTLEVGRSLTSASGTETFNGHGKTRIVPPRYPITAVASLTVDGTAIPARANVTSTGYLIEDGTNIVLDGYLFTKGVQNVVLSYTAGFTTIPSDVEQAVTKMTVLQFQDRNRVGQASRSVAGESVSFGEGPVLAYWNSVVDFYRSPNIE